MAGSPESPIRPLRAQRPVVQYSLDTGLDWIIDPKTPAPSQVGHAQAFFCLSRIADYPKIARARAGKILMGRSDCAEHFWVNGGVRASELGNFLDRLCARYVVWLPLPQPVHSDKAISTATGTRFAWVSWSGLRVDPQ